MIFHGSIRDRVGRLSSNLGLEGLDCMIQPIVLNLLEQEADLSVLRHLLAMHLVYVVHLLTHGQKLLKRHQRTFDFVGKVAMHLVVFTSPKK